MTGPDIAHLLDAARADGRRRLLGIVGGPGAGKSTLVAALAGPEVAVVGMDGWHLANAVLDRLGRRDRKGAPDTFDAAGYVAFLERARSRAATVWAPEFRREIEEPIAGALEVPPDALVLVTEGNYLLMDEAPWDGVRALLDEVWFLAPDEDERRARLVARHERHGRSHAEAVARADGSDAANARMIAATAHRADRIISY
ncbi:nucleoside/nucleotide kinase family protein [Actinomycetospora sp. NBRC 106375]|uniref:nucleoside/nucleotide kinase family protein n=1 Tax=Actinomycetospora sp. NBRC 106375 TaxID=3032207 RepID=UPI0024A3CB6C|nr:nucleoside/nucleotide kinase family protein [Actinomycetospora sp. NBRC 106375]GLZ48720.1 nucleoside/nucleotide kinase family protein [Actinomycetospora sp. NBRC 106375]